MKLALERAHIRRVIAALAMVGAAAAGACSSTAGPKIHLTQADVPSATFTERPAAQPAAQRESFFDPFAIDAMAERTLPPTIAATNGPVRANPGGVSIYGDLAGPGMSATPRYDGAENLTQVSFASDGADFDPDLSRDGKWIVFASTQHRPNPDIYVKGVDSRTVTQLTADGSNDVMPVFSPDGKRIAFASDRAGSWDIYVMGAGGGQPVQITNDVSQELHPTWSPDGARLAYCRLAATSGRWELWVVDVANPAVQRFLGYGLFPSWSPKEDKILFQRSRERGDRLFSVWTLDFVNGEGQNFTEIVSTPAAAVVNPTWSPDGRRIAFATIPTPLHDLGQRPDAADLWIINADGSGRANLTGGRFVNLMPSWSADGRIYFISDRGGRDNIWSLIPEKAIYAAGAPKANNNLVTVPENDAHDGDGHH